MSVSGSTKAAGSEGFLLIFSVWGGAHYKLSQTHRRPAVFMCNNDEAHVFGGYQKEIVEE